MATCSDRAWNGLVLHSDYASYKRGSSRRAAALASMFMSGANHGGLNSFLTSTYDLDAEEVLSALTSLGAGKAAQQLEVILTGIGTRLPASSANERWKLLEERWCEGLDEYDVLTEDADEEMMAILHAHVAANETFYSHLH